MFSKKKKNRILRLVSPDWKHEGLNLKTGNHTSTFRHCFSLSVHFIHHLKIPFFPCWNTDSLDTSIKRKRRQRMEFYFTQGSSELSLGPLVRVLFDYFDSVGILDV